MALTKGIISRSIVHSSVIHLQRFAAAFHSDTVRTVLGVCETEMNDFNANVEPQQIY